MQKNTFQNRKEAGPITRPATSAEIAEQMRSIIVDAGGGRGMGETYDQMVWRAARALGLTFARAWSYFYFKVKNPPAADYLSVTDRWRQIALDRQLAEHYQDLLTMKANAHERICAAAPVGPDEDGGWLRLDG